MDPDSVRLENARQELQQLANSQNNLQARNSHQAWADIILLCLNRECVRENLFERVADLKGYLTTGGVSNFPNRDSTRNETGTSKPNNSIQSNREMNGSAPTIPSGTWHLASNENGQQHFIDIRNISGDYGNRLIHAKTNSPNANGAKSSYLTFAVHCNNSELALLDETSFSEIDFGGARIKYSDFRNSKKYAKVAPKTVGSELVDAACFGMTENDARQAFATSPLTKASPAKVENISPNLSITTDTPTFPDKPSYLSYEMMVIEGKSDFTDKFSIQIFSDGQAVAISNNSSRFLMHKGNGYFEDDKTKVLVDERNKRVSVDGVVISNVQIIKREPPKTFEQMAEDARKRMKALKGKIVRLNSPQGDWILYENADRLETYFEKNPSGDRSARNFRMIEYTDNFMYYPVWIASQRAGSQARANAKVSYMEFNCNERTYYLRKLQFLGGPLNRLSDLATYVENDPIFYSNQVFSAISRELGGYRLTFKDRPIWLDSYAFACMN
jgi:hypothetical protein